MLDFRTDLALERRDLYKKRKKIETEVEGIKVEEEKIKDVKISRVSVLDENGEKAIGKPIGMYITMDIKNLKLAGEEEIENVSNILTNELNKLLLMHIEKMSDILIVGLGNSAVTPDSLGPKVVENIDVTRHILKLMPDLLDNDIRPVSAIAPGVLGTTGIETQEILKGVIENTKPKLLIVIDALASKSIERISSSIQLSDTGIVPGAGVGNARKELSKQTLGVPVIAIGIPTCVEAATIAADSLSLFIEKLEEQGKSNEFLNQMNDMQKYEMVKELLNQGDFNFIVTPKEIDELIEKMKEIISNGIRDSVN